MISLTRSAASGEIAAFSMRAPGAAFCVGCAVMLPCCLCCTTPPAAPASAEAVSFTAGGCTFPVADGAALSFGADSTCTAGAASASCDEAGAGACCAAGSCATAPCTALTAAPAAKAASHAASSMAVPVVCFRLVSPAGTVPAASATCTVGESPAQTTAISHAAFLYRMSSPPSQNQPRSASFFTFPSKGSRFLCAFLQPLDSSPVSSASENPFPAP